MPSKKKQGPSVEEAELTSLSWGLMAVKGPC